MQVGTISAGDIPWVLLGDINDQVSHFVALPFTNSATISGLHRDDSAQVGTISAGDIGQAGYSLGIGQLCEFLLPLSSFYELPLSRL